MYLQGVKICKNYVDQINKKILTLKKFPEVAFFFSGVESHLGDRSLKKEELSQKVGEGVLLAKKGGGGGAVGN